MRTPEIVAKAYLYELIEDAKWETPRGQKAYKLFSELNLFAAAMEFEQIKRLPESDRMRDIMERMGE